MPQPLLPYSCSSSQGSPSLNFDLDADKVGLRVLIRDLLPNSQQHGGHQRAQESQRNVNKYEMKYVQHHYQDFTDCPYLNEDGSSSATQMEKKAFPVVLHLMLNDAESCEFDRVISWQPHGRAFRIHNLGEILPIVQLYFGNIQLASFQRQLTMYGFKRLYQKTADHNAYYHERFLRYRVDLCSTIRRIPKNGNQVRRTADPKNEPDFYGMKSVLAVASAVEAKPVQQADLNYASPETLQVTSSTRWALDYALKLCDATNSTSTGMRDLEPLAVATTDTANGSTFTGLDLTDSEVLYVLQRLQSMDE